MVSAILRTEKLCKSFSNGGRQQHVIKNMDLEIMENDFTIIMGASGSGKSTLLYALSGMDKPTIGKVLFAGREIQDYSNDELAVFRQGKRTDLTLSQVATKLDTAKSMGSNAGESRDTVFRYIRLTHLVPELLELVDDKRIAFTPAVELSYLTEQEQYTLLDTIESEDCTPSLSQAQRMKKLSQLGRLTADVIYAIMSEDKPNQREKIKLSAERVREYFPKSYTTQQMEDTIIKLLEQWHRQQQRKRNDAR